MKKLVSSVELNFLGQVLMRLMFYKIRKPFDEESKALPFTDGLRKFPPMGLMCEGPAQ